MSRSSGAGEPEDKPGIMIIIVGDYFFHCFYIDSFDGRVVDGDRLPSSMKHSGSAWPQVGGKKLLDPPVSNYSALQW